MKREPEGDTNVTSVGMNGLLKLAHYQQYEERHPGFLENIALVVKHLNGLRLKHADKERPFTIIEMGAGPGNVLTHKLSEAFTTPHTRVIINELDTEYVAYLRNLQDTSQLSIKLIIPDAQKITDLLSKQKDSSVDAIVSNFAMHHLPPKELALFFKEAKRVLTPRGKIIAGEEFLRKEDGAHDRAAIHIDYHGRVILEALKRDEFESIKLAELEFAAMVSGLKTVKDMAQNTTTNKQAVQLLKNLEQDVTQITLHCVNGEEEKTHILKALNSLEKQLEFAATAGLAADVEIYDPDQRKLYIHPKMDYKITFKAYAETAKTFGFETMAVPTGATGNENREWHKNGAAHAKQIDSASNHAESPGVYVAVSCISSAPLQENLHGHIS